MGNRKFQLTISGFTGGLNTEKSPLNVLPSEMMDGSINVDLLSDGSIRPRRGIDFLGESATSGNLMHEIDSTTLSSETYQFSPSGVYHEFTDSVGDKVKRVVLCIDNEFKVYRNDRQSLQDFDDPLQTISLGTHAASNQKFSHCVFAPGDGKLFFAGPHMQLGYLSLNAADSDILDITYLEVWYRDVTTSSSRSSIVKNTISGEVQYFDCVEAHTSAAADEPGVGANWTTYWRRLGFTPVNSPSSWAGSTAYKTNVTKLFDKTATVSATTSRPQGVAFLDRRLWVAHNNTVYYTRVITKDEHYQHFLQDADPFDSDDNEPVADDGGFVKLQGYIEQIEDVGKSMYAATNKGYEQLTGTDGFKHTDYFTATILGEIAPGKKSMVKAEDQLYIFTGSNIWKTNGFKASGEARLSPVGDDKIQSYYSSIPFENKSAALGVYSPSQKKIYYFHNKLITPFDSELQSPEGVPGYSRNILIFDILDSDLGEIEPKDRQVKSRFQLYEYADDAHKKDRPYIAYSFIMPFDELNIVVDSNGNIVKDSNGDTVVVGSEVGSQFVFLSIALSRGVLGQTVKTKAGLALLDSGNLKDWSADATKEINYTSRVVSGVQTLGAIMYKKAVPYLFFVFERLATGVGSCNLKTSFNWVKYSSADSINKLSASTAIYKENKVGTQGALTLDEGNYTWYKHRVRGRGNAFQVIIEGEPGKDFHLIGWAQQFYGNTD